MNRYWNLVAFRPIAYLMMSFLVCISLMPGTPRASSDAATKGITVVIKDRTGKPVGLYNESHALVIGVSDYTGGWPDLESVSHEVGQVQSALSAQGFHVQKVLNPDSDELYEAFESFVDRYGFDRDNRLVFFFSGHGYTRKHGKRGYLVPADAPDPRVDEKGFVRKALNMGQMLAWAREIEAKHALFAFDSCFSGTVFKAKALPAHPPHISHITSRPVRQFISAGGAGEEVPANSVFTPSFVRALRGDGDLDRDGYVTGTELGMYLHRKVLSYDTGQHPQYGKIKDPDLDEGDFVFLLASSGAVVDAPRPAKKKGVTLSIECNVSGAGVFMDGKKLGTTPLKGRSVSTGEHRVRVEKAGYDAYERRVGFDAGRSVSLYVDLSPVAPQTGRLFVETEPSDARVRILNIVPRYFAGIELDPGRYEVEVTAQGFTEKTLHVNLGAAEDKTVVVRLEEVSAPRVTTSSAPHQGDEWTDPVTGMEFVWVPGGCFQMGSPTNEDGRYDEGPVHKVRVDGIWMGKYEVTNVQYRKFKPGHTSKDYKGNSLNGDDQPAVYVSWDAAKAYAKWLGRQDGGRYSYRLPSEAEWEYAARAGTRTIRFWGDDPDDACRYANVHDRTSKRVNGFDWKNHNCDDGYAVTAPVGSFQPNNFGLYDMLGNVWEWCEDIYAKDAYSKHSRDNPIYSSGGSFRVCRGGSWRDLPRDVRSAFRVNYSPDDRNFNLGFRLLRIP